MDGPAVQQARESSVSCMHLHASLHPHERCLPVSHAPGRARIRVFRSTSQGLCCHTSEVFLQQLCMYMPFATRGTGPHSNYPHHAMPRSPACALVPCPCVSSDTAADAASWHLPIIRAAASHTQTLPGHSQIRRVQGARQSAAAAALQRWCIPVSRKSQRALFAPAIPLLHRSDQR